jgi:hypothetical protein
VTGNYATGNFEGIFAGTGGEAASGRGLPDAAATIQA